MIITATATATTTDCCDLFHISDRFQVPISQVIYYNISNMSPLPQLPLLPLLLPHCHRLSRGWQRARFARGRHSSRGALRSGQGSKSDRREGTGQVRGAVCCAVLCCVLGLLASWSRLVVVGYSSVCGSVVSRSGFHFSCHWSCCCSCSIITTRTAFTT